MKILFILLFFISVPVMAATPPDMKNPTAGKCDKNYLLIEGVCIREQYLHRHAAQIKQHIETYRQTGKVPQQQKQTQAINPESVDETRCKSYRARLKRYQAEGVMALNTEGEIIRLEGDAAKQVIARLRKQMQENNCTP